jgi:hypothetical protein
MHMPDEQPSGIGEANRRKQQTQQPRQLLSCTKCRERKVKVSITVSPSGPASVMESEQTMNSDSTVCCVILTDGIVRSYKTMLGMLRPWGAQGLSFRCGRW